MDIEGGVGIALSIGMEDSTSNRDVSIDTNNATDDDDDIQELFDQVATTPFFWGKKELFYIYK
jgi:hypothetical protein